MLPFEYNQPKPIKRDIILTLLRNIYLPNYIDITLSITYKLKCTDEHESEKQ